MVKYNCATRSSYFYVVDEFEYEKFKQHIVVKDNDERIEFWHKIADKAESDEVYIDGDYRPVYGEFDNYLTVSVKPSITLEGDDFIEVCLYKDGKEVSSTYPDFLFDPIRLEYNNEEYHIQLEKECKEKRPELRYTEDYF